MLHSTSVPNSGVVDLDIDSWEWTPFIYTHGDSPELDSNRSSLPSRSCELCVGVTLLRSPLVRKFLLKRRAIDDIGHPTTKSDALSHS